MVTHESESQAAEPSSTIRGSKVFGVIVGESLPLLSGSAGSSMMLGESGKISEKYPCGGPDPLEAGGIRGLRYNLKISLMAVGPSREFLSGDADPLEMDLCRNHRVLY